MQIGFRHLVILQWDSSVTHTLGILKEEPDMAEAMTVETIVEADWQMRGFWTRLRFPLQTPKGGWSDIDLVAYNPEDQHLAIAE